MPSLYLETSAVLSAVLGQGEAPDLIERISSAQRLLTSRLSLVETGRAFVRLRLDGTAGEKALADVEREADALWSRCLVWELTPAICRSAASIAPRHRLRTLDALHLATWAEARRRLGEVELVTADQGLEEAAAL